MLAGPRSRFRLGWIGKGDPTTRLSGHKRLVCQTCREAGGSRPLARRLAVAGTRGSVPSGASAVLPEFLGSGSGRRDFQPDRGPCPTSIGSGKAIAGHGCQSSGRVGPAVPSRLTQVLGNVCASSTVLPVPFLAPRGRRSQDTVVRPQAACVPQLPRSGRVSCGGSGAGSRWDPRFCPVRASADPPDFLGSDAGRGVC